MEVCEFVAHRERRPHTLSEETWSVTHRHATGFALLLPRETESLPEQAREAGRVEASLSLSKALPARPCLSTTARMP